MKLFKRSGGRLASFTPDTGLGIEPVGMFQHGVGPRRSVLNTGYKNGYRTGTFFGKVTVDYDYKRNAP